MAATARTWSIDKSDAVDGLLDSASPQVMMRYQHFEKRSNDINAKRLGKNAAQTRLLEERNTFMAQRGHMLRDMERSGKQPGHEVSTTDPVTGAETVTFTADPAIERFDAKIAKVKVKLAALEADRLPTDHFDIINEWLRTLPPGTVLMDADISPVPPPNAGQDERDVYNVADADLKAMEAELEDVWNKPRPVADIKAKVHAVIDAAAKAPRFGALARGFSTDRRGNRKVEHSPQYTIGWPKSEHGAFLTPAGGKFLETRDPVGLLAWLLNEPLKKAADDLIDEKYNDQGAMSAEEKKRLIPTLERKIWQQRQFVEACAVAAEVAGFVVKRPKQVDPEILLGIAKLGSYRAPEVLPEPASPEPATPAKPKSIRHKGKADLG
jgi:hypothetical protein